MSLLVDVMNYTVVVNHAGYRHVWLVYPGDTNLYHWAERLDKTKLSQLPN